MKFLHDLASPRRDLIFVFRDAVVSFRGDGKIVVVISSETPVISLVVAPQVPGGGQYFT